MFTTTIDDVRRYWNSETSEIRESDAAVNEFAQFERWRGKKVLEIGCGIGTDAMTFAQHGADVTVIDVSPERLAICKARFENSGLTAQFYEGNAERLCRIIPIQHFDLVYAFGVLHHTPNPYLVVEQIRRYMHSESELRLTMHSKWSWNTAAIVLRYGKGRFWKAADLVAEYSEAQTGCPVTYTYSASDIRHQLLRDFKVSSIRKDNSRLLIVARKKAAAL